MPSTFFPKSFSSSNSSSRESKRGVRSEGDCCVCQRLSSPVALKTWRHRDLDSAWLFISLVSLSCLCFAKTSSVTSVLLNPVLGSHLDFTCAMLVALSSVNTLFTWLSGYHTLGFSSTLLVLTSQSPFLIF